MKTWRRPTSLIKCRLLPDVIVVILWIGALLAVHFLVQPRHQGFFCDDDTIKYPYVGNTVSNDVIVALTLAVPVVIMLFTELLTRKCLTTKWHQNGMGTGMEPQPIPRLWEIVVIYLGYFGGYLVLTMMVVVLKMTTGQLRPHFLAVCKPDVDMATCHGYVSSYNCTNTEMSDKYLRAARQSFPSGHAAYSVYMALFMIFYVEVRLRTCGCGLLKLTSYGVLTSYALWCSATRISDHMHHMTDVVAGGLLGLLIAVVTFARGAVPYLQHDKPCTDPSPDVEDNAHNDHNNYDKATITVSANSNNFEDNDDIDDDDEDEDSLTNIETEAPSTPTPLLPVSTKRTVTRATASPFILDGNRHKFARKSNSSIY